MDTPRLLLDTGSGGKASHRLIKDFFLRYFANETLNRLDDAAMLKISGPIAMSTDSYTVTPLFFPGGDIGTLAINGTVNDVAMLGARPLFLSCAFILEEGLEMEVLERIVRSMAQSAAKAQVHIVTGDTKVVPKGAVDQVFINTTGIGEILVQPCPQGHRARPGDAVLVSGTMGDHGLTILATREGLSFEAPIASDCAGLGHLIAKLLKAVPEIHVLRDPTRGGLATTLNEIAGQSGVQCLVREEAVPINPVVAAGCSFLGLDPLYLANEGKLICVLPEEHAEQALRIMREDEQGQNAARIGTISDDHPGRVVLQTSLGGHRLLDMLEGEQLPRIC